MKKEKKVRQYRSNQGRSPKQQNEILDMGVGISFKEKYKKKYKL